MCVACPVFLVLPFCRAALSERIYMCRRSSGSAENCSLPCSPPLLKQQKFRLDSRICMTKLWFFNPNILYLDVRTSVKWVLLCYDIVYGDWGFKKGLWMLNNHFFYKFGQVWTCSNNAIKMPSKSHVLSGNRTNLVRKFFFLDITKYNSKFDDLTKIDRTYIV